MKTWYLPALMGAVAACTAPGPETPATLEPVPAPTAFVVDPSWPKDLPEDWILGQVAGVDVGGDGLVWIVHRPTSLTPEEAGAAQDPPLATCCRAAPAVIAFDAEGSVVHAFGGPGAEGGWPETEHGLFVDHDGYVWIASAGPNDHVVLKFTRDGERVLQIGEFGVTGGSNDPGHLGLPTDVAVDPETNEVFISDGYGNRRVVVYDAVTGEYRRHWGAYGEHPHDEPMPAYDPDAPPSRSFDSPVHAVRLARDGRLYVADRVNNRIQVFDRRGSFLAEGIVAPRTLGMGSMWDVELSRDEEQSLLYVPDGMNRRVWILRREDLSVVSWFGRGGKQAGQFGWIHNVALDAMGNLYVTEVETGKRIQRFRPVG